jgi:uracil-DNA glycosylase
MEAFFDSSLQCRNVNFYPLNDCHADWREILTKALKTMDKNYLEQLMDDKEWLPGKEKLFASFSLPLAKTQYILLGESPYPRKNSANGYAFWDNAVGNLWSLKGLSTAVNKATSLRNLIKMLLIARGVLDVNVTQENIAQLDKSSMVQTAEQLFEGMMRKGVLLLNASLVYAEAKVPYHARHWRPFMESLFAQLSVAKPNIHLILLGKIAETVSQDKLSVGLMAEHPYNISFISNQRVIDFFKPLDLLQYE